MRQSIDAEGVRNNGNGRRKRKMNTQNSIFEGLELRGLVELLAKGTAGAHEWSVKVTKLESSWRKLGLKEAK